MPEETKPVEREAFEQWAKQRGDMSLKRDASGRGYDIRFTHAVWESWQASADAALERAAALAREHYERCVLTTNGVACEKCKTARDIENAILALKGSR